MIQEGQAVIDLYTDNRETTQTHSQHLILQSRRRLRVRFIERFLKPSSPFRRNPPTIRLAIRLSYYLLIQGFYEVSLPPYRTIQILPAIISRHNDPDQQDMTGEITPD
jgi:hypothetical protein